MKHTKLPWILEWEKGITGPSACASVWLDSNDRNTKVFAEYIVDCNQVACYCTGNHQEENAEFIVKACNNHYQLKAALQDMIDEFWGTEASTESSLVLENAKKAVKEAE